MCSNTTVPAAASSRTAFSNTSRSRYLVQGRRAFQRRQYRILQPRELPQGSQAPPGEGLGVLA
jgi:hypothetical protein